MSWAKLNTVYVVQMAINQIANYAQKRYLYSK
nr:MAG TPA: hypothetical protein [Caudoviricetes sp.]DAU00529.1 MAG TPA: hypothetical protein [Caudoviricetes sp.]